MDTNGVLDHHLQALLAGDVDEVIKDYDDKSVVITADGPVRGLAAIRDMFVGMVASTFEPGTYEIALDARYLEGEVAFITWHGSFAAVDIPLGVDTFVVRNGKIVVQTFTAKMDPK